jgi:hypothetical protein
MTALKFDPSDGKISEPSSLHHYTGYTGSVALCTEADILTLFGSSSSEPN